MAAKEQEKPLAAAAASPHRVTDTEEAAAAAAKPDSRYLRHRKCILCGGCAASFLVVLAVVIVILALTVFHVKNPTMTFSDATIEGLQLSSTGLLRTDVNITLGARVAVKNPNAASMRFTNFTTAIYYGGEEVGEAQVPAGNARARKTMSMNVTMVLMADRLTKVPGLVGDIRDGVLEVGSSMLVKGRVKMLGIIKKHVAVGMNCTMSVDIQTEAIQIKQCSRHVSL